MARDRQKQLKQQAAWERDHCIRVALKFNKNTDTDILSAIENAPVKATELKRLIRLGIEAEKSQT